MSQFIQRLQEAALYAGVPFKQADIARSLGIPRQTVHCWFHGTEPDREQAANIAQRWKVSQPWLENGSGSMTAEAPVTADLSHEERDIIRAYRSASAQWRQMFYSLVKGLGKAVLVAAVVGGSLQQIGGEFNNKLTVYTLQRRRWFVWLWLLPRPAYPDCGDRFIAPA